ncbi:MAG: Gfo/Idh/MocA family protein [Kiritimatiellia bacterium]
MAKIRFGVIGCGGMGNSHLDYMVKMRSLKVTAVCDVIEECVKAAAAKANARPFLDAQELLDSKLVDAVLIATPHYFHPPIAIEAFRRGIHVLSEKPLGVTLTPVDAMLEAAKQSGCKFAVMYQNRARPLLRKAKQILERNVIGEILRVYFLAPCYRTQTYWESDPWRGTWRGEGGGVLVNQAPHYTDMLYFLCGRPSVVLGRWSTHLHKIEVEDEAECLLTWPNGATGYYATSVNEAPPLHYMRIMGDKGVLEIRDQELWLAKFKQPLRRFTLECPQKWATPKAEFKQISVPRISDAGHRAITENFVKAIQGKADLLSPGEEGINQVEISCAILLSGVTGQPVTLPVDRAAYDRFMEERIRNAASPKTTRKVKDAGVRKFE